MRAVAAFDEALWDWSKIVNNGDRLRTHIRITRRTHHLHLESALVCNAKSKILDERDT
jgi:hypothetical protein